jgi:hypothetical protein
MFLNKHIYVWNYTLFVGGLTYSPETGMCSILIHWSDQSANSITELPY